MSKLPPLRPDLKPYYDDGHGIVIYHGDSGKIMRRLSGIDCMITDPPYGVNLGNSKESRAGLLSKAGYSVYKDTPENYRDIIVPILSYGIQTYSRSAVFGCAPNLWLLPAPDQLSGIFLPAGCGRNPWGWTNLASLLLYGSAPDLNLGAKKTAIESTSTAEKNGHPCPKPIQWMTWLISLVSRKGELIVDPFLGSGTTLRAAKDLGRRAIGIDIEEKYCEIAARRLQQEILL